MGIDLLGAGEAENTVSTNDALDADDGPNRMQNFPTLRSAIQSGNRLSVEGELISLPNTLFQIEFFVSRRADRSGFGQGERLLQFYTSRTDATGKLRLIATVSGDFNGQFISATATNTATGDSSEFSQARAVEPLPTISGFSPTSGGAGTVVTITGTNLDRVRRVGVGAIAEFTIVSPTTIRAVVPVDARTGRIHLFTADSIVTSASNFVVTVGTRRPVITRVAPNSGPVGTIISIEGQNLANTLGVLLSGIKATIISRSATLVRARVAVGTISSLIFLTTPDGTVISRDGFTVTVPASAPVISSFSPVRVHEESVVTIIGRNFGATPTVRFGDVVARVLSATATQLRVVVPAGALITHGRISVTSSGGTGISTLPIESLSTSDRQILLREITPSRGTVGTKVLLRGLNLARATEVFFGGVRAAFEVVSTDELRAVVPPQARSGQVIVKTADGEIGSPGLCLVLSQPSIARFTPERGGVSRNTLVTIDGRGFTGATSVKFGMASANFVLVSDSRIIATLPALSTGNAVLAVTTPVGSTSGIKPFIVRDEAPTIADFSPRSGRPGTQVLITGTNLGGATVNFSGGAAASVSPIGDGSTQILAVAPGNVQTGSITVTTAGGTARTNGNFTRVVTCIRGICPQSAIDDDKSRNDLDAATNPNGPITSPVRFSSGLATRDGRLLLTFSGALAAASASQIKVVVAGHEIEIESVSYNAATHCITLSLTQSTLGAGTLVGVTWRGLTDAQQRAIPSGGSTFVVR